MTDLELTLFLAASFAVVWTWQSWAWAVLLPGIPLGMMLRRRTGRVRVLVIGGGAAMILLAANAGVIGAKISREPDFAAGIYSPYVLWTILAACWLFHSVLALLLVWCGTLITERVMRAQRLPTKESSRRRRRARPDR